MVVLTKLEHNVTCVGNAFEGSDYRGVWGVDLL